MQSLSSETKLEPRAWWYNGVWIGLCFLYVASSIGVCTAFGILANSGLYMEPPNGLDSIVIIAGGFNIAPVDTTVLKNPDGIDARYWGHAYQSAANQDIASALNVWPDQVHFRGEVYACCNDSTPENTTRIEFVNAAASVMQLRADEKLAGPKTIADMAAEMQRQLGNGSSALYKTDFGKTLKQARLESTVSLTDSFVDSEFSIEFYSIREGDAQKLPGEVIQESPYASRQSDSWVFVVFSFLLVAWAVGALPIAVLLMSNGTKQGCCSTIRVSKDDIEYFQLEVVRENQNTLTDKLKRVHPRNVLVAATVFLTVILFLVSIPFGTQFQTNWEQDPPLQTIENRPFYWALCFCGFLVHQVLGLFLQSFCC